jgi:hypothetical protein
LNDAGSWQKITDRLPCTIGSVEKQRITWLKFRLHGVTAGSGPRTTFGDRATEFPRVDENIYVVSGNALGRIEVSASAYLRFANGHSDNDLFRH